MHDWIERLFAFEGMDDMGHHQRVADLNLGLGWLYYALARILRPSKIVVIGSWRGFVPVVFAKALADNGEGGTVEFIDPSLVDDFWKQPEAVRDYFAALGLTNLTHHLMTTQEFAQSDRYRRLEGVGIAFIDGMHTEEQVRLDYEVLCNMLAPDGLVLFHDTATVGLSNIYGADLVYERRTKCFVDTLRGDPELQILDLPFDAGVTILRQVAPNL